MTDISRKASIYRDAAHLEETATLLRNNADIDWSRMSDFTRHEKEREIRSRVKYSIDILINNMPI